MADYVSTVMENPDFFINFSELTSMQIFSGNSIYAFQFNYINGKSFVYGNFHNVNITSIAEIQLTKRIIKAVNISLNKDKWLNSMQFLILDLSKNSYSWTPVIGKEIHDSVYSLNAQSVNSSTSMFFINSFLVKFRVLYYGYDEYQFNYNYTVCEPFVPDPLLPKISLKPNSNLIRTSTIRFNDCIRKSDIYFTKVFDSECPPMQTSTLDFSLLNLKSIVTLINPYLSFDEITRDWVTDYNILYTLKYLNDTKFKFGFGNSYDPSKALKTEMSVINKTIVGINIYKKGMAYTTTPLIDFIIYDPISKTIQSTAGQTDPFFSFKSFEVMPSASFFQITSISCFIFFFDCIRKMGLYYNIAYKKIAN